MAYSVGTPKPPLHGDTPGRVDIANPVTPNLDHYYTTGEDQPQWGYGNLGSFAEAVDTPGLGAYILAFFIDVIPRQIYLHLLLRIPNFYFSRVTRIFHVADLSTPKIEEMARKLDSKGIDGSVWSFAVQKVPFSTRNAPPYSPIAVLKDSWEYFIDSVLREWKMLNIVSVLLLS